MKAPVFSAEGEERVPAGLELRAHELTGKGFTPAMLSASSRPNLPKCDDEKWDPIFARGAQLGIVFVLPTGAGLESVIVERGPGDSVITGCPMHGRA